MPAWTCWKSLAEWSSLAWDGIISPSIQTSSDPRGAGTPFGYFIYRETGLHTSRCLHSVALSTYWIQFQGRPCLATLPLDWDAPRPNHLPWSRRRDRWSPPPPAASLVTDALGISGSLPGDVQLVLVFLGGGFLAAPTRRWRRRRGGISPSSSFIVSATFSPTSARS